MVATVRRQSWLRSQTWLSSQTWLRTQRWQPWALGVVGAVAIVIASAGVASSDPPSLWSVRVMAAAVAVLAQAGALRFRQANRVIYLGWGEAAVIIVVYLVRSGWVPATIGMGALVGQLIYRLRTGTPLTWRVLSNAANLTIAAAAATAVAHAVTQSGIDVLTPRSAVGLLAGAIAYCIVAVTLVNVATATSAFDFLRSSTNTLASKLQMIIGSIAIGLIFVAVFESDKRWLLIMPVVLALTYQTYVFRSRTSDERRIWREFAEVARSLHRLDERGVAVAAAAGVQRLFVAAAVEIWVDRLGGATRGYRAMPLQGGVDVVELAGPPVDHPVMPSATRALAIGGTPVGEVRVWMPRGSRFELRDRMAMSAVCEAIAASLHDASAHRALRVLAARTFHDAQHDVLTGIPNQAKLVREGEASIAALSPTAHVAVFLLGINRFKEVNDSLGHFAGDDLLRVTASRLAAFASPGDHVARLSGDKFGMLLTRLTDQAPLEAALARAHDLASELAVPTEVGGLQLAVEASIGVAAGPVGEIDVNELLRRAEIAMYRAKHGAGSVAAFGSDSTDVAVDNPDRLSVVLDLREALERADQLVLEVQPTIDLDTGAPLGGEALIRWHHPRRGVLAPADFVDIVDASDLVAPFTRYVIDRSLALANLWASEGLPLPVSVNLSPRSLADVDLPSDIAAMLRQHRVPPHMLILEITERAVPAGQIVVEEVLGGLRSLGVQLAVDDYGTGYSSLTFLTRVQVDEVKVDTSFVRAMIDSPEAAAIVRTTVDLGRRLGVRVVAEGVESAAQRAALRALGCVAAQGRHLVPPICSEETVGILHKLVATATPDRTFPL